MVDFGPQRITPVDLGALAASASELVATLSELSHAFAHAETIAFDRSEFDELLAGFGRFFGSVIELLDEQAGATDG